MLKRLFMAFFVMLLVFVFFRPATYAAVPIIADPLPQVLQPPVIVSGFGGGMPSFIELYNQSASPMYLGDTEINFTVEEMINGQMAEESFTIVLPEGWLLSKQYLMLQHGNGADPNIIYYPLTSPLQNPRLVSMSLTNKQIMQYVITPAPTIAPNHWAQHKQRGNATLKLQGVFATDYAIKTTAPTGNADSLYIPPLQAGGLQVMEILPNAQDCPPYSTAYECGDYIKLYNAGAAPMDLGLYRLRTDSGGSKSSGTNTFTLSGILQPGEYFLVNRKDTEESISLTNTGGYVWIEDRHGVSIYQDTLSQYPDASAVKNKGMSWAIDNSDGVWKWMQPQPVLANYWAATASPPATTQAVTNSTDCGPGKERNPETNRCRNIPVATTSNACKDGQERNPATNRCRSIQATATSQKACNANQYRNPDTGRCKNIAAASTLVPCKDGQERSPETNRCRKKVKSSQNIEKVQDVSSSYKKRNHTPLFVGLAVVAVVGYGVYEWRQDIITKLHTIKFLRRRK